MISNELLLKEMGQRIIKRRKQMRLTQEELAEKLDVTPQMISNAELGKKAIRPENLYKLSKVFHVSVDYLLTGEIVDKDFLVLQNKLQTLPPDKLHHVEDIIDSCLKLSN